MTDPTKDHRRDSRGMIVEWYKETQAAQSLWSIETVKHLAFVNAAGLAGSATLYASSSSARIGAFPSIAFAIGLIAAVVDMHLNTLGYSARQREIRHRIKTADAGLMSADDLLKQSIAGEGHFRWAGRAGALAGSSFIAGIAPFIHLAF
jgi:hypothetical protein